MLDSMSHRGPDGQGEFRSPSAPVWLGHKRLAIIDQDGGNQPMTNEDGSLQVVFNGCIYNHLELRTLLKAKGHVFANRSDTEVLLHAYEEFGPDMLERLNGMFAFAIWDERRGELFCARDRLGIKPFYYARHAGGFAFASEIKAILAADWIAAECHADALSEYLTFQAPLGDQTLFRGIKRLPPGHTMTVGADGKLRKPPRAYWTLSFAPDTTHDEPYFTRRLLELLQDAVDLNLRADIPVGAHLSGGMDSSLICTLASQSAAKDWTLHTFTGAFDESPDYDESGYARLLAESVGAAYHETRPGPDDFIRHMRRIIHIMDEPTAGPGIFPQYMVSKLASEHVSVLLGGVGGDEIFVGYARYLAGYLEECLKGAIYKTADTERHAATLSTIIPSLPLLQKYTPLLRHLWGEGLFDAPDKRYLRLMDRSAGTRSVFSPDAFSSEEDLHQRFAELFLGSDASSLVNSMLHFDLKVHLPALLHVEDRTSMAWSLESRVPLLDHRVCEFMASVPPVIKFRNGRTKYLLRQAVGHMLPPEILNREDKMGFPVPLQHWFGGDVGTYVREILLGQKARQRGLVDPKRMERLLTEEKPFDRTIWGALCLELWFQEFIDS